MEMFFNRSRGFIAISSEQASMKGEPEKVGEGMQREKAEHRGKDRTVQGGDESLI